LHAYTEKSLGKKTLIFNNGINTPYMFVYETFREAGYPIRHLITPVVLRNVKIFYSGSRKHQMQFNFGRNPTGFDEPTVTTIK
jgi:hypothetical protein